MVSFNSTRNGNSNGNSSVNSNSNSNKCLDKDCGSIIKEKIN